MGKPDAIIQTWMILTTILLLIVVALCIYGVLYLVSKKAEVKSKTIEETKIIYSPELETMLKEIISSTWEEFENFEPNNIEGKTYSGIRIEAEKKLKNIKKTNEYKKFFLLPNSDIELLELIDLLVETKANKWSELNLKKLGL